MEPQKETPPPHSIFKENILRGIDLLYNLQFDDAEKQFKQVIRDAPDKPAGYFYLAMVTWSRIIEGYWSVENINAYRQRIDRTVQIAQARISRTDGDSDDYFYLGGALGFMGRFELMQKNWFSSFRVSRRAIAALETCLEKDPDNRDVLLGLGTFDYYTAKLSGVLRFLSFFFLHKPDKEEGLRKLHVAAAQGVYSKTEAKSVLLHICLFLENDYTEALSLARELGQKYGRDPTYWHFYGVAAIRLGREEKYKEALAILKRKSDEGYSEVTSQKWKRRVLYLESVYDLFHSRYKESRSKLNEILEMSDPVNDPAMATWPLVKMGMAYDLEGNRQMAVRYYQQVIERKNAGTAGFMAERCLDEPPVEKDSIIGY